ncbi:hypothetical protein NPS42_03815 [Pseudomonas putida]|uniref:hypothetical protein n=1 Tax=Pseudomonas putida TaxID=303 RepID=UPI0023637309|nr:hypothetical protein [Pseudomonas putida]MDD2024936.1 hypothetical protein [Pseudomonas putida]HDS1765326.1 hypothetical protein [Pseudomonas putida]
MYLLDSDAARKLCQYQLIHELASALRCTLNDLAVLPQLTFQLRLQNPAAALKKLGSEMSVALAHELVGAANIVEVRVDQSNFFLDVERPDIDSGEAVLFASLYQNPRDRMISGDKRAYVALSKLDQPSTEGIWARLICFEEAMMLIVQNGCFAHISAKVRARGDVDIAMSLAFGRSQTAEQSTVLEALSSYTESLHRDTEGKWVHLTSKPSHATTTAAQ